MNMDLKRYDRISGLKALERLVNKNDIFNVGGQKYYIANNKLVRDYGGITALDSGLTIEEILNEAWYVKKPFDVRAEMLARPCQWVGAFKDGVGKWHKLGFDLNEMIAVRSRLTNTDAEVKWNTTGVGATECDTLNISIPIEDVPKEELT